MGRTPVMKTAALTAVIVAVCLFALAQGSPPSKRGSGMSNTLCREPDLTAMDSLGWWYNWGLDINTVFENVTFTNEYVPMVYGEAKMSELDSWTPHPSAKRLLG